MSASECPVNFISFNQIKVRLTAFFVFATSLVYVLFPHWSIGALLAVDFFFRGFGKGRYSVFGWASGRLIKSIRLPVQQADSDSKEFAAPLGFLFSDCLFIFSFLGLYAIGIYVAGLLICFSFLEALLGFCTGCHIYTAVKKMQVSNGKLASWWRSVCCTYLNRDRIGGCTIFAGA